LSDPVLSVRPGSKYPNTRRDNVSEGSDLSTGGLLFQ
jgi:hypothetical protein